MKPGIYPAAITPMVGGDIDVPSACRLLAHFESKGCAGVVIAGTNGEGPSLAAVEKRDLIRSLAAVKGSLSLILGVMTSSLSEAIWLSTQARKLGADGILLMPPMYFREAPASGVCAWLEAVMSASQIETILYNFPARSGFEFDADMLARLSRHEFCQGLKDSSGNPANLAEFREAMPGKSLFVGAEALLLDALEAGWQGSISGLANSIPAWLVQIASERSEVKLGLASDVMKGLKSIPQPAGHKQVLERLGIIASSDVRLPLESAALPKDMFDRFSHLFRA